VRAAIRRWPEFARQAGLPPDLMVQIGRQLLTLD
jgi:hypothetical protein